MNSDTQTASPPPQQQFITPNNLLAPGSHCSSRSYKVLLSEAQAYLRLYYHEHQAASPAIAPTITTRLAQVQLQLHGTRSTLFVVASRGRRIWVGMDLM